MSYADGYNNCKHMAAVLYQIDCNNEFLENDIFEDNDQAEEDIENIVKKIDSLELEKFIIKEIKNKDKLAKKFKNYFSQYYENISIKDYISEVDTIFYNYLGMSGFINYNQAYDFGVEISSYLESIKDLVYSKNKSIIFDLIDYILKRVEKIDMDDSLGTSSQIADDLFDMLELLIEETNMEDELYNKIFDYVLELYDNPNIYVYDSRWDDLFYDFFLEKKYLLKKLDFINKKIDELEKSKKRYISEPYIMKFNLMKKLNYPFEEIVEFLKKNSENKDIELRLGQFYFDIGMYSKGIQVFNRLKKVNGSKIRKLATQKMIDYYKKNDNKEALINELMVALGKKDIKNYEYFLLLKEQYNVDEWEEVKEDIVEKINVDDINYIKILAEGEMYEKLIKYFEESDNIGALSSFEYCLKDKYPKRILKIYQNKCEEMVKFTNGRSHYRSIAGYLRKMKKYPKGEKLVDELINRWIVKYSRRTAMKEEFLKVKSGK